MQGREAKNLEEELKVFLDRRPYMPSYHEFEARGAQSLYRRVVLGGGFAYWSRRIGVSPRKGARISEITSGGPISSTSYLARDPSLAQLQEGQSAETAFRSQGRDDKTFKSDPQRRQEKRSKDPFKGQLERDPFRKSSLGGPDKKSADKAGKKDPLSRKTPFSP